MVKTSRFYNSVTWNLLCCRYHLYNCHDTPTRLRERHRKGQLILPQEGVHAVEQGHLILPKSCLWHWQQFELLEINLLTNGGTVHLSKLDLSPPQMIPSTQQNKVSTYSTMGASRNFYSVDKTACTDKKRLFFGAPKGTTKILHFLLLLFCFAFLFCTIQVHFKSIRCERRSRLDRKF